MAYVPASKEEEEFLKNYNPNKYKNPSVTADGAIFAGDMDSGAMRLLLVKRGNFPYKGAFCLPGGFIEFEEDLIDAVKREIKEETSIENVAFQQVKTFGTPGRDPRYRIITVLFAALVRWGEVTAQAGDDAAEAEWFEITDYQSETFHVNGMKERVIGMTLRGSVVLTPKIRMTLDTKTAEVLEDGGLGFDHAHEVVAAYEHVMAKI